MGGRTGRSRTPLPEHLAPKSRMRSQASSTRHRPCGRGEILKSFNSIKPRGLCRLNRLIAGTSALPLSQSRAFVSSLFPGLVGRRLSPAPQGSIKNKGVALNGQSPRGQHPARRVRHRGDAPGGFSGDQSALQNSKVPLFSPRSRALIFRAAAGFNGSFYSLTERALPSLLEPGEGTAVGVRLPKFRCADENSVGTLPGAKVGPQRLDSGTEPSLGPGPEQLWDARTSSRGILGKERLRLSAPR